MTASEPQEPELKNQKLEMAAVKRKKFGLFRLFFIVFAILGALFLRWLLFPEALEVMGKVRPVTELEIKTLADGILKGVRVQDAQRVHEGGVLFEFQNEEINTALLKAIQEKESVQEEIKHLEALIKHTDNEVENGKVLYEKEVIGKLKLEEIELEYSQNEGLLARKRRELEEVSLKIKALQSETDALIIKAPLDGIFLGDLLPRRETFFKKGETLGAFFSPKQFYLDAVVLEIKTLKLKMGDGARVTFKAFNGSFKGKVIQIDQVTREEIEKVFKVKYVVRIRILLEDFPEGLKPGMRGAARIYPYYQNQEREFKI